MQNYQILKSKLYKSIIVSLLKRNILSVDEAVNCLKDINKDSYPPNDLIKDLSMVKHKGLTNSLKGTTDLEVIK